MEKVYSAPAVQNEITGGQVSITGNFTLQQAKDLKTVLDSGSLPVKLSYSESRVVGPTPVSYTHLTLPTTARRCRSRWSPYH